MKATKNEDNALMECYRRLYKASTPSGDFDELVKNATKNDRGEKVIPFNDYCIKNELMDSIIEQVMKEFKIYKYRRPAFKFTIHLGCSPKSID